MTNPEKMQIVVEAAGGCWHKRIVDKQPSPEEGQFDYFPKCDKCEIDLPHGFNNPSPTDLNELFRLAEKIINVHTLVFDNHSMKCRSIQLVGNIHITSIDLFAEGCTPAEALLNALYEAVS